MYDSDGTPSHAVISKLQNISQHVKIFTEVLQKSVGIDVDDEYQVEVYSFYKGIFEMADGDDSDVTLIEAEDRKSVV